MSWVFENNDMNCCKKTDGDCVICLLFICSKLRHATKIEVDTDHLKKILKTD